VRAYLDASAAAKLFRTEPESAALSELLASLTAPYEVVSSVLLETELRRIAVREESPQALVTEALRRIGLLELTQHHFYAAGLLPDPSLRSLDALHLVSAMRAGADVMVAYDRRLLSAAWRAGMATLSPM
jgi:uncharacterized protein